MNEFTPEPSPGGTEAGSADPWLGAGKPVEPEEPRRYFRCHPLRATISVVQCRLNRCRLTPAEALLLPVEPMPWELQPGACANCPLSLAVDAGRVPFYSAEEVLEGKARMEVPGPGGRGGFPPPWR